LQVVKLYEQRGYMESGLEGDFRTLAHRLEQDIRQQHPEWLSLLLQLR